MNVNDISQSLRALRISIIFSQSHRAETRGQAVSLRSAVSMGEIVGNNIEETWDPEMFTESIKIDNLNISPNIINPRNILLQKQPHNVTDSLYSKSRSSFLPSV